MQKQKHNIQQKKVQNKYSSIFGKELNIYIAGIYSSKHLISSFRHILEFGLGRAEDALIVLHLRPAVALVVYLQAVVQQVKILLHFLGLVYWVRV